MSLQHLLMRTVDGLWSLAPQKRPSDEALRQCRIVSHRGEHGAADIRENTLAAFRCARDAGVWGIECDIRWTRDDIPVICHDANTARVFGQELCVATTDFHQLRENIPEIPTLAELIAEFGGNTHLMLEVKEPLTEPFRRERLKHALLPLMGGKDYHFLSLTPELFTTLDWVPAEHCIAVSEVNAGGIGKAVLEQGLGGHAGHYLLIHGALKRRHQDAGQLVGAGFPSSRAVLFREINRGSDWIFSNHAVRLQRIIDAELGR